MKKTFVLILSFLILNFSISLSSADVGDWVIRFDEYNDGEENITVANYPNTLITTQRVNNVAGAEWQVSNSQSYIGSNSWWIDFKGLSDVIGWWNLTDVPDYIGEITFWVKLHTQTANNNGYMRFFLNGVEVLKLEFDVNGPPNPAVWVYDVDNNANLLYFSGTAGYTTWNRIVITHISGNLMNYSVYNQTSVLINSVSDSCRTVVDWESFGNIRFNYGGNANANDIFIDQFIYNVNVGSESCPELQYANVEVYGFEGVPDVLRGDRVTYTITVFGEVGTIVKWYVRDPSGANRWQDSYIIEENWDRRSVVVYYYPHWPLGDYQFQVVDNVYTDCNSTWWNETFSVSDEHLDDYNDTYYNSTIGLYAEFDTINYPNLVRGDDVPIVYYFPLNSTCLNRYDCGFWYIIALYRNNVFYEKYIVDGRGTTYRFSNAIGKFDYDGIYELRVFNMSDSYNVNYSEFYGEWGDLVYVSDTLTIGEEDVEPTPNEQRENEMNILFGVGMIIMFGIIVAILLNGSPTGFFAGAIIGGVTFSNEALGSYQFLPSEVGILIVLALAFLGFILFIGGGGS